MKRGTNGIYMKESNKRIILNLIRQGNYSRSDISSKIGLTKAAVSIIVDNLIKDNIVFERSSNSSGVGRHPVNLLLNENAYYSIGVNITRSYFEVGIINLGGSIMQYEKHKIQMPHIALPQMAAIIKNQLNKSNISKDKILGIGVTAPGPVDYKNKKILTPPNFSNWHKTNIGSFFDENFEFKTRLENVANAYALNEKYFGLCMKENNYIVLIVDEGIGSGIIIDSKIYRGNNGFGNELGHTSIDLNGIKCSCGNYGCLEKYASIPSILTNSKYDSWRDVCDKNDMELIKKESKYISAALVNAVNLFDINTVIIGGDIAYKSKNIIDMIGSEVNSRVITGNYVNIKASKGVSGVILSGCQMIDMLFM